jgi:hypothetical protein
VRTPGRIDSLQPDAHPLKELVPLIELSFNSNAIMAHSLTVVSKQILQHVGELRFNRRSKLDRALSLFVKL